MPEMTIQQSFDLAANHHQAGNLKEAESIYRQILALDPQNADSLHQMGIIAHQVGRNDIAVNLIQQAIAHNPTDSAAHSNLGKILREMGQLDKAIAACRKAITLQPDDEAAHNNLGIALTDKGLLQEAISAYRKALKLRPDYVEAYCNLGAAVAGNDQLDEAIAIYRQAISLNPYYPNAHYNLGSLLHAKGKLHEAVSAYRQAVNLKPDYAEAFNNLGNALKDVGQAQEAIVAHQQSIALQPNDPSTHGNLLLVMNYHSGLSAAAIMEEHLRWNRQHAEPLRPFIKSHSNDRSVYRRLRVGYVSPDFRDHSVAYFIEGLFENHDPEQVEIFCYADLVKTDAVTERIKRLSAQWRKIAGLSDSQVADLVRTDEIDILVDLAGHTANNRLPMFARKPAPVQVTWLGYPNTTGLDTIDYRFTDAFADPPGSSEEFHSEQLVRLPRSAWCYRPNESASRIDPSSNHKKGYITFGCFNAMPKINEELVKLWSMILHAVPESRLMLKNNAMKDPSVIQHMRTTFEHQGINQERLELVATIPDSIGHLTAYGRVNIAMDTFPYHGTTTTCEALWMGVPVVTLAGKAHVSRVGASLLSNLGHPEWIATSPEEYVKIATDLTKDLTHLSSLRNSLRAKMRASPLMDPAGFARNMESAYRKMWQTWCAQPQSPSCPK